MELHITGDPGRGQIAERGRLRAADRHAAGPAGDHGIGVRGAGENQDPDRVHEPEAIAAQEPQAFVEMFKERPAVHRFPGSMAGTRAGARRNGAETSGTATPPPIWTKGNPDGAEVLRRLKALPGFGEQKAKIFLALLGKQRGLQAPGWREAAGHYGEEGCVPLRGRHRGSGVPRQGAGQQAGGQGRCQGGEGLPALLRPAARMH